MRSKLNCGLILGAGLLAASLAGCGLTGCGGGAPVPQAEPAVLRGSPAADQPVEVDGSSTVYVLSQAVTEEFGAANSERRM